MAITGRWPRAVFYDSKTTLFDWGSSWRSAAATLVKKHGAKVDVEALTETWVRQFEGVHRRAAFYRYTNVADIAREALMNTYRMHGFAGSADDIQVFLDLQSKVELFSDTEEALTNQQKLGVRIIIYSDVESEYLRMYVSKFRKFKPDFVATTQALTNTEAGPTCLKTTIHAPAPAAHPVFRAENPARR
jgi:FMN phosphatase YigB (HAD superfamily)